MKIKLYADSSNLEQILNLYRNKKVSGFTTNPTLMKKAGVTDYAGFVKEVCSHITDMPVSFEIFADDYEGMKNQVLKLSGMANNIYVKIPVMNTKGESSYQLIKEVSNLGIKVNVTAIFTHQQVNELYKVLNPDTPSIISIFAGRIADTGANPIYLVKYAKSKNEKHEVLWASTREIYNVYEADTIGCDIITVSPEILDRLSLKDKDLNIFSLETVKMFYDDAKIAGFSL
jgi:transaldolase